MTNAQPPVFARLATVLQDVEAQRTLGHDATRVVILCILERLNAIDNPGAYLRRLTQQGRAGGFDMAPMLAAVALRRAGQSSADHVWPAMTARRPCPV